MGLAITLTLCLLTLVGLFLIAVRKFLKPLIPVEGKTNIPGPTEGIRWPIFGDVFWFYGLKSMEELYTTMKRMGSMRKVTSFYFGSKLVIFIRDAETAQAIIKANKCPDKEVEFYHAINSVTNGMVSKNGKAWSDFRRPFDKLIHIKKMNQFLQVAAEKTEVLCQKMRNHCNGETFDLKEMVLLCTLDAVLENMFGIPGTQQIENTMNLPATSLKLLDICFHRMVRPELKLDWMFNASPTGKSMKALMNEVGAHLQKMIDDCRENMEKEGRDPNDPEFEPQSFVEATIQVALRNNDSTETLKFSFLDMIVAGFDTSGVAVSSLLLFLAMHPEYQEKAYQEQLQVMNTSLDVPSREEMSKMNFLEMAFNEALRHTAPPILPRTVAEEFCIGNQIYPKGASLFFQLWLMMSDPLHWERPNEFYPEHFLPEKVAARSRGAFLAFSFGSRACAGKVYGILTSKLILSMVIRRFKFTTHLKFEDMSYKYSLMRDSARGYPVVAVPR